MKPKQRKNLGFIATFVCLSLIFAGASPSVLCETLQERGKFNGALSDLDNLPDLCNFKSEEKLGIVPKTSTDFRTNSPKIAEELYSSLSKLLQGLRIIGELKKVSDNLQAVFAKKLVLETYKSAFSLRKILKLSAFDSDRKSFDSDNFTTDKLRSNISTAIDFHIPFQGEIFAEFALSQNTTKMQVHRVGKGEISRILAVHCFPRASI